VTTNAAAPAASLAGLYGEAQARPLYSRLPRLYFHAPRWLRSSARRLVGARRGSADRLIERYLARTDALPDGDGQSVPVLLTHDVDTAEGLARLPRLLECEEALGLASLTLLVTHRYRWSRSALAALTGRGHCFGVHDTTHDNRLAYLSEAAIEARLRQAQEALGVLDSGAFRAPAFLRSRALYQALARCVRVDLSTSDGALLWPHPGDGIGTPFPVRHGPTMCVPTTLPRDGELIALGLGPRDLVTVWQRKALALRRVGAPVVVLTHPDPSFTDSEPRIAAYATLLAWFTENRGFRPLPPATLLDELTREPLARLASLDA
jgi:hypothetical protein